MNLAAPAFLLVALVSLLALVLYLWVGRSVLWVGSKHGVAAPAIDGHGDAASIMLAQLVPFLVALWLCGVYLRPLFAAIVGLIWLAACIVSVLSDRRGFLAATIATLVLIAGALVGIVLAFARLP